MEKQQKYTDLEDAAHALDSKKNKKKEKKEKTPSIRIEGSPFGVYIEGLIWLLVFLALLAVFIFQFRAPEATGRTKREFERFWSMMSIGYIVVLLLHEILATRDG